MNNKVLITGGAGFIGSHLCEYFINNTDHNVVVIDNFNDYYDPQIKHQNIEHLKTNNRFTLIQGDIRDKQALNKLFSEHNITSIIHLAAMAGVRYSIEHPELYFDVNINGTLNLLECAKDHKVQKFLFASSSSVYGNNKKVPFSESDNVDHPISPYAASKKAGELLCFNYHHLYQLPVACLRFFTVYGPRQRPEMAIHKFAKLITQGKEIPVYNNGLCERDFTYIDDIIQGITSIWQSDFGYDVVNLGESKTITTLELIKHIEKAVGKKAKLKLLPKQPGDVERTFADVTKAKNKYCYQPLVCVEDGVKKFGEWFLN